MNGDSWFGKSLMKMINKVGDITPPCGTPSCK